LSADLNAKDRELFKKKLAYLTTIGRKTGKAHTIELWFAPAGGKIYLSHEGQHTDWMRNITKNERVRLRIGESSFEAEARVVERGDALEVGKRALYEKYYGPTAKATIDDWFELSTIVELSKLNPLN
jgi:deazaflavin-dependent oxidoreductase (nitroreductase family)